MKKIFTFFGLALVASSAFAQTTAMDFNRPDCNGNQQHLFADLDAGNVVIIEYFMTNCGSCVVAGNKLEALKTDLLAEFPGKIKSYAIGYTNSYSCATVSNWVSTNGFTSTPMDSGAVQVAYYGGMGMPTVVVLGGTNHAVLGSPYIGLATSDTTTISNDVHNFFAQQAGISELTSPELKLYPNPANESVQLDLTTLKGPYKTVCIRDVNGKVVFEKQTVSGTVFDIDTKALQQGLYVVELKNELGSLNTKLNIIH